MDESPLAAAPSRPTQPDSSLLMPASYSLASSSTSQSQPMPAVSSTPCPPRPSSQPLTASSSLPMQGGFHHLPPIGPSATAVHSSDAPASLASPATSPHCELATADCSLPCSTTEPSVPMRITSTLLNRMELSLPIPPASSLLFSSSSSSGPPPIGSTRFVQAASSLPFSASPLVPCRTDSCASPIRRDSSLMMPAGSIQFSTPHEEPELGAASMLSTSIPSTAVVPRNVPLFTRKARFSTDAPEQLQPRGSRNTLDHADSLKDSTGWEPGTDSPMSKPKAQFLGLAGAVSAIAGRIDGGSIIQSTREAGSRMPATRVEASARFVLASGDASYNDCSSTDAIRDATDNRQPGLGAWGQARAKLRGALGFLNMSSKVHPEMTEKAEFPMLSMLSHFGLSRYQELGPSFPPHSMRK